MKRGFLFFLLFWTGVCLGEEVRVTDLRYWTAPDHTRIVFDLSSPLKYNLLKSEDPKEIRLELLGAKSLLSKNRVEVRDGLIKEVVLQEEESCLRVLVELEVTAPFNLFSLKKYLHKPHRVVLDVLKPGQKQREEALEREVEGLKKEGVKIVVVDPGHGGEDSGAIGRRLRLKEKDVVLDISRRMVRILNKVDGVKAFLTRDGDYFVPLRRRIEIAKRYKADVFVSIHTNANRSRWERGSSTYVLSLQGASDEASQLLAERENAADMVGGIEDIEDDTLAMILLDLAQTATLNQSLAIASKCISQIASLNMTENDGVKRAGFVVLKAVDIPSILVETAFISNIREERLLGKASFRQALAEAISKGILEFLELEEGTPALIQVAKKTSKPKYHTVKKGETLWSISRRYGVSLSLLKKVNGLGHSNVIGVGQRLLIPTDD
jgi:N-acetylmuramoyl-L-alanine amidase